jgi:phage repressor protein C with HTH and peptisase S24 domain
MIFKIVKKLIIIGFGLGVFLFLLVIVTNYFWPEFYTPPPIVTIYSDGESMKPTLPDGKLTVNYSLTPRIGDIVAFKCFTEKCINGETNYEPHQRVKRLTGIDDRGCFYFLGDNPDHSWDSRNYGYLCPPDDVKILGVVVQ